MIADLKRLVGELEYYAGQLDVIGGVLVDLVRSPRKHKNLIMETGELYQLLAIDLVDIYHSIKRSYREEQHTLGSVRKDPSLEQLENSFMVLREASDKAQVKAGKLSRYETAEARRARAISDELIAVTENAAKVLVGEAHKKGQWTAEWEKRIGIRGWLR